MTEPTTTGNAVRILAAGDGEVAAGLGGITDRFMIDGKETGGRFALVQLSPNVEKRPLRNV
jgi:hypothetical protein